MTVQELQAASARLRKSHRLDRETLDYDHPDLGRLLRGLLDARDPLAAWLDQHADEHSTYDCDWPDCAALAVAKVINRSTP